MASFRCYDNSDVIATLIITNFHLYLIQLWCQFFQIFAYGDVVYAQTWEVLTLKNYIEPPYSSVDRWRSGYEITSQRHKFHTDDVNECLHNKSGSLGVLYANLFDFTFLLVDFGKVLCSSANELQQTTNASS